MALLDWSVARQEAALFRARDAQHFARWRRPRVAGAAVPADGADRVRRPAGRRLAVARPRHVRDAGPMVMPHRAARSLGLAAATFLAVLGGFYLALCWFFWAY